VIVKGVKRKRRLQRNLRLTAGGSGAEGVEMGALTFEREPPGEKTLKKKQSRSPEKAKRKDKEEKGVLTKSDTFVRSRRKEREKKKNNQVGRKVNGNGYAKSIPRK